LSFFIWFEQFLLFVIWDILTAFYSCIKKFSFFGSTFFTFMLKGPCKRCYSRRWLVATWCSVGEVELWGKACNISHSRL